MEVRKLATVINQQNSPNVKQRFTWRNLNKALSWGYDTYASSDYSKTNYPWTLTAHSYGLNIPDEAYITSIKFNVGMRLDKNKDVSVPSGLFCIYGSTYKKPYSDEDLSYHSTGFHGDMYVDGNPTPSNKLSTQWRIYTYTLDKGNLAKLHLRGKDLNETIFGLDLRFQWSSSAECGIDVAFVFVTVNYNMPCHQISYSEETTAYNPPTKYTGEEFDIVITHSQKCVALGGNQVLDVDIPWGTELVSYSVEKSSFNPTTRKWTVNGNTYITGTYEGEHKLHLTLRPCVVGLNELSVSNTKLGKHNYYYNVDYGVPSDFDDLAISLDSVPHKYSPCCAVISINGISDDDTASYTITDTVDFRPNSWEIAEMTSGVSINSVSDDKATVTLNVPVNERFTAYLTCCFSPKTLGENTLTVSSSDTGHTSSLTFNVEEAHEYNFKPNPHTVYLTSHRVLSDVETESSILPFKSDDSDAYMIQSKCSLHINQWEELDYIGCVPLEHLHFDPKSTYKDTLIDTRYKNKRYMGKKLASDEDISLNVRLHPHQVTTIQGLIDMDKPIPINANHKCFEGDALNHRGWAEIYSIKTEETNPHWYKCDIDVKYLTHNLNTRFNIIKGNKVNTYPINEMLVEVFESGDTLSSDETNYFRVDTDGTFVYVDDTGVDPTLRNIFSIDNGQSFRIKSRDRLASTNKVSFEWNSVLLSELKENNIHRVIRLVDKDNNPVFEYEYTDYEFIYDNSTSTPIVDSVNASIVYRVHTTRGWEDVNKQITLRSEISTDGVITDSDDETSIDTSSDDGEEGVIEGESEQMYGSTLHFLLSDNKLNIIDEGFSGKELSTENSIELMGDEYYWVCEFVNNNFDEESNDCTTYVDFIVQDTYLSSRFNTNMVVSPFPVANKHVLFTREAEEGTVYYLKDDGEEFSYLVEPYYQYHNGTDLVTEDGISIFNLNYGYEIVYIQNGLVRLGFDRLNGRLFLGKYDPFSNAYITTHNLRLTKYDDINIKSITDDKIEIQASDVIFTIWRGHPYIMVTHPTEDIIIETRFSRAWAEGVGSDPIQEYPSYYDLQNNSNLLPSCVGGKGEIKSDCIDVSSSTDEDRIATELTWNTSFDDIIINTDKTFSITGLVSNPSDTFDLNDVRCDFGELEISYEVDNTIPYSLNVYDYNQVIGLSDTTDIYAKASDLDGNGVDNVRVDFYKEVEEIIELNAPDTLMSGDEVDITLTYKYSDGTPIENERVDFYEDYEVSKVDVMSDVDIVGVSDTIDITAIVHDEDGSRVKGEKVDFYEGYSISEVHIMSTDDILKVNDTVDITTIVKDEDGSRIIGEKVNFYTEDNND